MRTIIAASAALLVAASVASAQQKAPADAVSFAKKVASANTFEIQSSELAQERAQSGDVRAFAQKMIADHTKAGQEFKSVVQEANVSPPPPEQPDTKQKATLSKLRNAQGAAFDKAYLTAQLKAHKEAVSLFRNYAKSGRTAPLKQFALNTLPTLEQHLSMVQELTNRGVASGQNRTGTGSRAIGAPEKSAPGRTR
jgi:putative membrane protein